MQSLELVDELYEVFVGMLRGSSVEMARQLAYTLGLTPSPSVPWSRVFGHEVTLAAPALIADAMPDVDQVAVRDATFAHLLGVIEAFGADRVTDGQVPGTPPLTALLERMKRVRDAAVWRVCPGVTDAAIDFELADQKTLYSMAAEQSILREEAAVTFASYETISLGKQSPGFPAPLALAFAAGWDARKRDTLQRAFASVWLGLQMHDDVVDWEGDHARGGAWAVCLAKGQPETRPPARTSEVVSVRQRVLASGVLEQILARSRFHFRAARRRARVLGARRFEAWALEREATLTALVAAERRSPGYAVRAHALAPWAGEVLA